MAGPGYSINDLIQNAGQVKRVYESFCHQYKSADAQLGDLAYEVEQFQVKLKQYQRNLLDRGLQDPGSKSAKKTLEQCLQLLDDYKSARKIKDGRRISLTIVGTFKTALFTTEEDELKRLRDKLNSHKLDMVLDQVNLNMSSSKRNAGSTAIPTTYQTPMPAINPEENETPISPPRTPALLQESPLLSGGTFGAMSPPSSGQRHGRKPSFSSPDVMAGPSRPASRGVPATSPRTVIPPSPYVAASPPPATMPLARTDPATIPEFTLPDSALLYGQAEVHFGPRKRDYVNFRHKPSGMDYERGREIEIKDTTGESLFRHRIRLPAQEACWPYTWHINFRKGATYAVNFQEPPLKNHKISQSGGDQTHISSVPKYHFTDVRDYEDFQAQVRGKLLEGMFEVSAVRSALSSTKKPDATDQHLKIWKDSLTKECSISYFASTAQTPAHVEFPFSAFRSSVATAEKGDLRLDFNAAVPPKKLARTFSRAFSRSPTENSVGTSAQSPEIFSRNDTGLTSGASSNTTAPSRNSIASFQSTSSTHTTPDLQSQDFLLESQAKKLKYLEFEFSDVPPTVNPITKVAETEYERFEDIYERLYREQTSQDLELLVKDWQSQAAVGRPESIINTSPRGTPWNRSPELRPHQHDVR